MDPVSGTVLAAAIASVASIVVAAITRPSRTKLEEIRFQTTQNGGKNDPPTIPDQLHNLDTKVDALIERFDRHIEWHMEKK
jgi:hypothetical protein